jgi:pyruvate dehydrogenase E2 component (dihydrolipoamide acetyltransferase)
MNKVVMPKLGDTMEEGKILSWHKHEGDEVKKGDALAEIETEKVNIEAEAFVAGVLRKILVAEGETVPVGTAIALVGDPKEPLDGDTGGGGQARAAAAPAASTPSVAAEEDPAAEPAPEPAMAGSASRVAESAPVATVYANGRANGSANGLVDAAALVPGAVGRIFISPIARRIASEHQLDVAQIHGTGPGGRIIREDVQAALERNLALGAAPAGVPVAAAIPVTPEAVAPEMAVPASVPSEDVEIAPLSQMRKTIARRLQQSMQTAPHFYVTVSIDATRLGELRASVNEYAASLPQPVKISLNDLIVKGVALALRQVPGVNVSFDGERLLLKKRVHVGVAVALDRGLIVPVVRDADRLTVLEIARESQRLAAAAKANTLKPEEFQGGTFTVSNLGMYGVESFTAVINPPESAILAVGAATPTPVVRDGQVVVRDVMKVTLSSDHRAVDGAVSARFLQALKTILEQPMGLVL